MASSESKRPHQDGRDEMNLADFPISALQRQQPCDAEGRKLDRVEYLASRYDPVKQQRVTQKVTLSSSAREGLPTPADEHVILALLYVAKHSHNFGDPVVHFRPSQLFEIMGWAPNGRSYVRLRDVLRRLKSLTIRYENAWWDAAGREYEEEVATGIIGAYRIARQVSGPQTAGSVPSSWVSWTAQFQESLRNGNIKRLNLDVFFKLRSPTAQRMYRFLDKRFYTSPRLTMDLVEFACGHVGLTESDNVAVLKRRLAPAIAELEAIAFLLKASPEERYQKVRRGIWRVHFQAGCLLARPASREPPPDGPAPETPVPPAPERPAPAAPGAEVLAREFYRRWDPAGNEQPGARDLEHGDALLRAYGAEQAAALLPCLVEVTRRKWPDCRSFSGAVQKYQHDALKLYRHRQRRAAGKQEALASRLEEEEALRRRQEGGKKLGEAWAGLAPDEQAAIRAAVLERLGDTSAPAAFLHHLCLEELARRRGLTDAANDFPV